MSSLTIEDATRHLAGQSSIKEFIKTDLAVTYVHFRRVVTGKRTSIPYTLINRLHAVAAARGESISLVIPDLPSPIQIGIRPPAANPQLN